MKNNEINVFIPEAEYLIAETEHNKLFIALTSLQELLEKANNLPLTEFISRLEREGAVFEDISMQYEASRKIIHPLLVNKTDDLYHGIIRLYGNITLDLYKMYKPAEEIS
ncbi:hypothetical protein [Sodalis sp. RH20]|uniref:hypothetical protein n=1 Tax=unclassified Sodalis (in: enterobacteria) TaxID=2636512 RepID=UPI0039B5BEB4